MPHRRRAVEDSPPHSAYHDVSVSFKISSLPPRGVHSPPKTPGHGQREIVISATLHVGDPLEGHLRVPRRLSLAKHCDKTERTCPSVLVVASGNPRSVSLCNFCALCFVRRFNTHRDPSLPGLRLACCWNWPRGRSSVSSSGDPPRFGRPTMSSWLSAYHIGFEHFLRKPPLQHTVAQSKRSKYTMVTFRQSPIWARTCHRPSAHARDGKLISSLGAGFHRWSDRDVDCTSQHHAPSL